MLNKTIENLMKNVKKSFKAVQIRFLHSIVLYIQRRSGYINMGLALGSCARPVGPNVLNLYPNLISAYIILYIWQKIGYSPPSFVSQNVLTSLSDDLSKADVIIYM